LQAPVQQTCAPLWVGSQAFERQSPSVAQLWPSTLRQAPFKKTSPGLGQTQEPSAPQTRPEAPQLAAQQRWAPLMSAAQSVEAHCAPPVQACPLGRSPLQTPVVALQPLPHAVGTRCPSSQRAEEFPWQTEPSPSHCTQLEPSAAQELPPPQGCAQHTLPPLIVATHAPEAQSVPTVQLWPWLSRQAPPTA
jgi:hypothetical protein